MHTKIDPRTWVGKDCNTIEVDPGIESKKLLGDWISVGLLLFVENGCHIPNYVVCCQFDGNFNFMG